MQFDPNDPDPAVDEYDLFASCLVPRPIAWVSTMGADAVANLAPFSFVGAVSGEPPMLVLGVGRRRGERKDTARNLIATREAVVHVPDRAMAEKMVATSASVPPEVDEFVLAGLRTAPSRKVKPPRVAAAKIALECKVVQHMPVGAGPTDLFFLEVVCYHVADDVIGADGLPDARAMRAVGRLAGSGYCEVSEVFSIPRPE
jgi:flavin reductase (DIM6/NTAB) family NADH-FMN oxidoreductase RutF